MLLLLSSMNASAQDTISSSTTNVVNPTVEYLVKEFKSTMEQGVALATPGIQQLLEQVSMLGWMNVGTDIIYALISSILVYISFKLVKKGIVEENEEVGIPCVILGAIGIFCTSLATIISISSIQSDLKMAIAPMLWMLEKLL